VGLTFDDCWHFHTMDLTRQGCYRRRALVLASAARPWTSSRNPWPILTTRESLTSVRRIDLLFFHANGLLPAANPHCPHYPWTADVATGAEKCGAMEMDEIFLNHDNGLQHQRTGLYEVRHEFLPREGEGDRRNERTNRLACLQRCCSLPLRLL
jgi:hypothetical protein